MEKTKLYKNHGKELSSLFKDLFNDTKKIIEENIGVNVDYDLMEQYDKGIDRVITNIYDEFSGDSVQNMVTNIRLYPNGHIELFTVDGVVKFIGENDEIYIICFVDLYNILISIFGLDYIKE